MNQREINRLSGDEKWELLRQAAESLNSALNLFGIDNEPMDGLLDPDASEDEIEERLEKIMEPECSHRKGSCDCAFPAWFMKQAQPQAREFLKLSKQIRKTIAA